jgi:hypothetical protein
VLTQYEAEKRPFVISLRPLSRRSKITHTF